MTNIKIITKSVIFPISNIIISPSGASVVFISLDLDLQVGKQPGESMVYEGGNQLIRFLMLKITISTSHITFYKKECYFTCLSFIGVLCDRLAS